MTDYSRLKSDTLMNPRILITSAPMHQIWPNLEKLRAQFPAEYVLPKLPLESGQSNLLSVLPTCDAWIAGTEDINAQVLKTGQQGRLRALVRWGVGMDNVDQQAAAELGVAVDRTPGVFGDEVADLGIGYMLSLARQIVTIDRHVRAGNWLRPPGISLRGKTVGVVGYGSIGQNLVHKLGAFGVRRVVYSQHRGSQLNGPEHTELTFRVWPQGIEELDFLILVCSLTAQNYGLVSAEILKRLPPSAYLINLGRGALVDENALITALSNNTLAGAALDVFQEEPLPQRSPLRSLDNVVLGTHNASNTHEGAIRCSNMAVQRLFGLLQN